MELDFHKLSLAITKKRTANDLGLREVADQVGNVSPSSLSRIEGRRVNDVNVSTFFAICDWLGVHPTEFIIGSKTKNRLAFGETDKIILAIRQLDIEGAYLLAAMVEAAFKYAKEGN